jgi:hypothetical protein
LDIIHSESDHFVSRNRTFAPPSSYSSYSQQYVLQAEYHQHLSRIGNPRLLTSSR